MKLYEELQRARAELNAYHCNERWEKKVARPVRALIRRNHPITGRGGSLDSYPGAVEYDAELGMFRVEEWRTCPEGQDERVMVGPWGNKRPAFFLVPAHFLKMSRDAVAAKIQARHDETVARAEREHAEAVARAREEEETALMLQVVQTWGKPSARAIATITGQVVP